MKLAARMAWLDYREMLASIDEELFQDWWQAYLDDPEILDPPQVRF